ncbi:hypothetical protein HID58_022254, partial [Brassica napus]
TFVDPWKERAKLRLQQQLFHPFQLLRHQHLRLHLHQKLHQPSHHHSSKGCTTSTTTTKPACASSNRLTTACTGLSPTGITFCTTSFTASSAYTNNSTTSTSSCQAQEKAQTQEPLPCPTSSTNSSKPSISSSSNRFPGNVSSTITISECERRKCLEPARRKSSNVAQHCTGNSPPAGYHSL